MMKTKSVLVSAMVCIGMIVACGGTASRSQAGDLADTRSEEGKKIGKLEITVDYKRQDGRGSNQYAVWVEDAVGNLVKTLYVTRFTAGGGYKKRPDCTPLWVTKAHAPSLSKEQIDAFSGATPQTGAHVYTWDGTDQEGKETEPGSYTFVVEATYLGSHIVLFKGEFDTGHTEITLTPEPEFNSDESQNRDMIQKVTARYIPAS
ncbi:MAG: DUF2271 domain-containing protein [Bacteroides sp.]|nr:DUF2271 domain-containing protein [Bacteroides sp.]